MINRGRQFLENWEELKGRRSAQPSHKASTVALRAMVDRTEGRLRGQAKRIKDIYHGGRGGTRRKAEIKGKE